MASNVLPFFWHLASSSKDTRLSASVDLVESLETFQRSFVAAKLGNHDDPSSGDEDEDEAHGDDVDLEEESKPDGFETDPDIEDEDTGIAAEAARLEKAFVADNAEDVVYSVRRLVRGLGSSRESSRLGFAVALTEILSRIPAVTIPQVVSLLIRSSPYSSGMKGIEERDSLFARLFGLTAVVQSGALYTSSSSTSMNFDLLTTQLILLGNTKAWLRESAWWVLVGALEMLLDIEVEWKQEAIGKLVKKVFDEPKWTQEKVAFAMVLERGASGLNWKSLLGPTLKHTPVLASGNLSSLSRILKESDSEEGEVLAASSSTGSWKPQLHFVWTIILDSYFPKGGGRSRSPSGQAPFQDMFKVLVDESLFATTTSSERKFWGFSIFERTLPLLPPKLVPLIFAPNFMRCWMNNLSSTNRYLHKAATQIARLVQDVVKSNPTVSFTLLATLTGKHGRSDFDRVSNTKTVESIMSSLDGAGVAEYVKYLQNAFLENDTEPNSEAMATQEKRLWALDQLLFLCRNGSLPREDYWISMVLDFLLVHGFFVIKKVGEKSDIAVLHGLPKPAVSEILASACRARFFSCVIEMTTASTTQRAPVATTQAGWQQGCTKSGKLWLERSLDVMKILEGDLRHLEIMLDADEEIKKARRGALATIGELKDPKNQSVVARGLEILLSLVIFQTYDEAEDALDMLEESNHAARRLLSMSLDEASSSSKASEAADAPPADALMDILVTLLEKASSDLRSLANLVFGLIASSFTSSSIRHLVAQLTQSATSTFESGDDTAEDSEEVDVTDSDEKSQTESEGESEEVDEENVAPVDPVFRQRVADALHVSEEGVVHGRVGESAEEDSEIWDDDQMMEVDEQLAEVFRRQAYTSKRSDIDHLQTESLHFRIRILDFFDVFIRKQSQNPLVIDTLLPLLNLVRDSGSAEGDLANKAAGILRARIGRGKEVPPAAAKEALSTVLTAIHHMARKSPSADFSALCSGCSLFVVRSFDASTEKSINVVNNAYRATLADFMTRKASTLHPAFILDYVRRFSVQAWPLRSELCDYIAPGAGIHLYRQLQCYNILQAFIHQLGPISIEVGPDQIREFVQQASGVVFMTLEEATTESSDWTSARLKEVVKFALQLARRSHSALSADLFANAWDIGRLVEVSVKVKEAEKTKSMTSVHGLLKQLAAVLRAKGEKQGKKIGSADQSSVPDVADVDGGAARVASKGKDAPSQSGAIRRAGSGKTAEKDALLNKAGDARDSRGAGGNIKLKKKRKETEAEKPRQSHKVLQGSEASRKKHKSSIKPS